MGGEVALEERVAVVGGVLGVGGQEGEPLHEEVGEVVPAERLDEIPVQPGVDETLEMRIERTILRQASVVRERAQEGLPGERGLADLGISGHQGGPGVGDALVDRGQRRERARRRGIHEHLEEVVAHLVGGHVEVAPQVRGEDPVAVPEAEDREEGIVEGVVVLVADPAAEELGEGGTGAANGGKPWTSPRRPASLSARYTDVCTKRGSEGGKTKKASGRKASTSRTSKTWVKRPARKPESFRSKSATSRESESSPRSPGRRGPCP